MSSVYDQHDDRWHVAGDREACLIYALRMKFLTFLGLDSSLSPSSKLPALSLPFLIAPSTSLELTMLTFACHEVVTCGPFQPDKGSWGGTPASAEAVCQDRCRVGTPLSELPVSNIQLSSTWNFRGSCRDTFILSFHDQLLAFFLSHANQPQCRRWLIPFSRPAQRAKTPERYSG